jgi:hypothetical protein
LIDVSRLGRHHDRRTWSRTRRNGSGHDQRSQDDDDDQADRDSDACLRFLGRHRVSPVTCGPV